VRIAYGRVSTREQADEGALERQRMLLEATQADLVLLDVGSGTNTARPGYQKLLQLIAAGEVQQVLVTEQDRLNRNLQSDLELWSLCDANRVAITDLHGREIEFRSPGGQLLATVVSALNQHRSKAYALKTQRGIEVARSQGLPARSSIPFGVRKVRNAEGRLVGLELDPVTAPLARQRVRWFLEENISITALYERIKAEQPEYLMNTRQLPRWLVSPLLTGRNAWGRDRKGNFEHIDTERSFEALISDAEHEALKIRVAGLQMHKAIRGRTVRMFSGLVRCKECNRATSYKLNGKATWYLRCATPGCSYRSRMIRLDRVFGVAQYALAMHAKAILPILQRPAVDPPEVATLQREIETLQPITGTGALIEAKRAEINRLRAVDTSTPGWLLVGALRSQGFWLMDDDRLNLVLSQIIESITVDLGGCVADAKVISVRCRTSPAEAPLPPDQDQILIPVTLRDLALTVTQTERMQAALAALL